MVRSGVVPTTQFAYRKGLGTCDTLLCVSHALQSALENMQEARIVQIALMTAFDRVNHQVIFYKLYYVGNGGRFCVFYIDTFSIKSITVQTGERCVKSASRKCFGPIIVSPVHL